MPRVRTLRQVADHYRTDDPETAVTFTALRRWVTSGIIPYVTAGGKYLLDLDTVDNFLAGGLPSTQPSGIKPISTARR